MLWFSKKNQTKRIGAFPVSGGTAVAAIDQTEKTRPHVVGCEVFTDALFAHYVKTKKLCKMPVVDVADVGVCSLLQVDLKGVAAEEKQDAIRWQIHELLDYPAEEAILDFIEVPIVGEENRSKSFVFVAAAEILAKRVDLIKSAGLELEAIDVPELALRNLLELFPNEPHGLCLLWLRENSGLFIVCRGGTFFFSRIINCGLQQIQQSMRPLATPGQAGETIPKVDEIVLEVQRTLDYCESNFRLLALPKILLAVCGEEPEGLCSYLDQALPAEVVSADFQQIIDFPYEIDSVLVNCCLPALGAALRGESR